MPTVPEYGLPSVRSTPDRSPLATPEAFGAARGRQLEQLGGDVQRAAGTGIDILTKIQEQDNLEAVLRAETVLKNAEGEFHNQVRERKGVNAKTVVEDARKFWEDQQRIGNEALGNDAQRRAFDKIYQQRRTASMSQVAQHRIVESRNAQNEAAMANVEATIQNGIENPGAADMNSQRIEQIYGAYGVANGISREKLDLDIAKAKTKMHAGVIGSLVDRSPWAARKYYNDYKDQILPSERDKVEDSLRAGETKGFAQRKAGELMSRYGGDYQKQLDAARSEVKDPDRQSALIAELRARQAELELNEGRVQDDAYNEALNFITDTGRRGKAITSINDIPDALWQNMSGTGKANITNHLAKIAENAGGPPKVTDREVQLTLEQAIEAGDITDEKQLLQYQPYLTAADYARARTKFEAAGKVDQAKLLKEFENRMGESRTKWMDNEDDVALWSAFQDYANRGLQDRVYTSKDIIQMADDFFLENQRSWKRDTTYGAELAKNPSLPAQSMGVYTVLSGGKGTATSRDMPRVIRAMSTAGITMTPENIGAALHLHANGKAVTQKNIELVLERARGE